MRRFVPALAFALLTLQSGSALAGKSTQKKATPAFGGYCPVAYVVMNQAVKGDAQISTIVDGHPVLFANADAKKMFDADPAKYSVAYDGWCATAVAMGKKMKSDPKIFTVHEGVTYLFSSADAQKMFAADPASVIGKAEAQWKDLH